MGDLWDLHAVWGATAESFQKESQEKEEWVLLLCTNDLGALLKARLDAFVESLALVPPLGTKDRSGH